MYCGPTVRHVTVALCVVPPERAQAVKDWRQDETKRKKARLLKRAAAATGTEVVNAGAVSDASDAEDSGTAGSATAATGAQQQFKAHVAVPSQEDMTKALVARKKQMVLAKYMSKSQQAKEAATRRMLNIVD